MRLQLAFGIAVFQVMLVGLARAAERERVPFDLVDYNTKPTYSEKNYWNLTLEEKVSIDYRPTVNVENGCDMYAAFFGVKNGKAQISGGLEGMFDSEKCRNKNIGTRQMYARYNYTSDRQLAILYAMFFPKQAELGSALDGRKGGAQYLWQAFVTVFQADKDAKKPADYKPQFIAWSVNITDSDKISDNFRKLAWEKLKAVEKTETHVKLKMYYNRKESSISHLGLTGHDGAWIPLIQYTHLEKEVQEHLDKEKWNGNSAPLSTDGFKKIVDAVVDMT